MPARIVIVQGSPRRDGNTDRAVQRLEAGLSRVVDCSVVRLADLVVSRCSGCRRCMTDGVCAIGDDDFPGLWEELRAARGIVQACPVYWLSPPGIMKDFIDRTHSTYTRRATLAGVPCWLLTVAADGGFDTCEEVMASWVTAYGGEIAGRARLLARDKGELEARPENLRLLDELAAAIAGRLS